MDDNLFEVCSFISDNFGISFDEAEIIVGKIVGTELIQANKEIKIYVTKNIKTPIYISQVKIPSLNERVRIYAENNNK